MEAGGDIFTRGVEQAGLPVLAGQIVHARSERLYVKQILLFKKSQPEHVLLYRCGRDKMF